MRTRPALPLLLLLAALLTTTIARADDLAGARAAYKTGVQHFNLGEYEQALERFKEAYRIHEDPTFLFNIGQCQRLLGHKKEAVLSFRSYLSNSPRAPNRSDVERSIDTLRAEITTEDDKRRQDEAAAEAAAAAAHVIAPTPTEAVVVSAPPPPRKPIYKKWWFWTAVGGVVVVGLGVGLGVGLTRGGYPHASTTDGTFHF